MPPCWLRIETQPVQDARTDSQHARTVALHNSIPSQYVHARYAALNQAEAQLQSALLQVGVLLKGRQALHSRQRGGDHPSTVQLAFALPILALHGPTPRYNDTWTASC